MLPDLICTKAHVSLLPFLFRLFVFLTIPIPLRSRLASHSPSFILLSTLQERTSWITSPQKLQALNRRPTCLHQSPGEQ
ncbi:hypothetical protein CC79DRAFT_1338466 [Sarocladium strictum]